MIKINKVDSLKKDREEVRYNCLQAMEAFVWPDAEHKYLCVKTSQGHQYWYESKWVDGDCACSNPMVIPVDAEINWAYKD